MLMEKACMDTCDPLGRCEFPSGCLSRHAEVIRIPTWIIHLPKHKWDESRTNLLAGRNSLIYVSVFKQ